MNSRERVFAALNHKEPDRVPVDIGATLVSGISAIAYSNLKKYLNIEEGHIRIYDVPQQLARVEDWFINRFNIDVLDVGSAYLTGDEDWYDVEVNDIEAQFPKWFQPEFNPDGSIELIHKDGTVLGRMSKDALVMDQVYYPFQDSYPDEFNLLSLMRILDKNMWGVCVAPPFSNMGEKRFWRTLRERAIELREKTNKVITLPFGVSIFQGMHSYRRMDKLLIDTARNPKKLEKFVDIQIEFYENALKVICKYLGDVIDIITFGDDLAENNGPMISPRVYKKFFKRGHEYLCDYIKNHSSMKIFFHTCGSVKPLIPDLIECGIDILNPIQINARDMDPKELKQEFGDELTFWGGGVDTRNVLNRESPKNVKKHVIELLEIYYPGGGYIFNTIHNILPDVPPENLIAMFEAIEVFNNTL
ncbi:MAG: methyltransferase [Candidatus Lokiarchaeota archaeon]|nr:methyltransferase [Candidatus Lokiarchaeota archaeon]MBD3199602.1 methyltransferase [Candidatus Lokiarchaeota archaeon]